MLTSAGGGGGGGDDARLLQAQLFAHLRGHCSLSSRSSRRCCGADGVKADSRGTQQLRAQV